MAAVAAANAIYSIFCGHGLGYLRVAFEGKRLNMGECSQGTGLFVYRGGPV